MNSASDPADEITGTIHEVGTTPGEPGWKVFSSFTFADGGQCIMQDYGPFASRDAAQVCADMAEGVEEITDDLIRRARRAYLLRMLK